jgi:hypothetical protein
MFRLALAMLLLGLLPGCSLFRKSGGSEGYSSASGSLLKRLEAEEIDFQTLSLSGKADISLPEDQGGSLSASYRIAIARDSLILIRITKVIEAFRICITRDSIYVADRINQRLYIADFGAAERYIGLKGDFGLLQDLLLGHFHPLPESLSLTGREGGDLLLSGQAGGADFVYRADMRLQKITEIRAENALRNQATRIAYGDFQEAGKSRLPYSVRVEVLRPEAATLQLTHRRADLDEGGISFEFSGLEGYERIRD